jgi:ribosomal protein S6
MSHVGFLHIREVDAIRYPIIKENNAYYFINNIDISPTDQLEC